MSITKAFSLIELILYIAILSIIFATLLPLQWNVLGTNVRTNTSAELIHNAQLAFDRISNATREANGIVTGVGNTVLDTHPATLVLNNTGDDIRFDTYTRQVSVGSQNVTIRTLRMTQGANPGIDLTTDSVDVTNFVVRDRTRDTESTNIKLELSVAFVNPGQDPARNNNLSLETAISIRNQ